MVDQTNYVNTGNGRVRPTQGMGGSVRDLVHDAIVLGELQFKLLLLDLREGRRAMVGPVVVLVLALCLALGCFPVVLAALGLGLASAGLPSWAAFLIAGLAGLTVSGLAAYIGWRWLKRELSIVNRSQAELQNNLAWLKAALKR